MKKHSLLSITIIFSSLYTIAQDVTPVAEDALRWSWNKPSGSARNQALGGANVALGSDLTSLFVNPAGIGLYSTSEATITPMMSFSNGSAKYFGNGTSFDHTPALSFGASGFVFNPGKRQNDLGICIRFGLGVNRTADFNRSLYYTGNNYNTSFTDNPTAIFHDYVDEAQQKGTINPYTILGAAKQDPNLYFVSRMGLESHLISINEDHSNNYFYGFSRAADVLDIDKSFLIQENSVTTSGGITEVSTGLAVTGNNLSIGLSVGVPILQYNRHREYTESDGSGLTDNYFNSFRYVEDYSTETIGVNIKAGALLKLSPHWRVGLALHTPTFYTNIANSLSASMTTDAENYDPNQSVFTSSTGAIYHDQLKMEYGFQSPTRLMAGVTFMFNETPDVKKQRGFITADVEFINMKAMTFDNPDLEGKAQEAFYASTNKDIRNLYTNGFNYRAGAELKFSPIMLRGGFSYFNNPYSKSSDLKASMISYSAGIGYRNKGIFIDAAYVYSMNKNVDFPYYSQYTNYYAETVQNVSNFMLTVGCKF